MGDFLVRPRNLQTVRWRKGNGQFFYICRYGNLYSR